MTRSIADTIRQVRRRVSGHDGYLSSVSETRTRYTLIDPILRALGWEISDPSQVKVEIDINDSSAVKKVDYALYRSRSDAPPWALVEAKRLNAVQIDRYRRTQSHRQLKVEDNWREFSNELSETRVDTSHWAELGILSQDDLDNWSQLTTNRDRLNQIAGYAREFAMSDGYAILTDGDEWVIYQLTAGEAFPDSPTEIVRILIDSPEECAQKLSILRRLRQKST